MASFDAGSAGLGALLAGVALAAPRSSLTAERPEFSFDVETFFAGAALPSTTVGAASSSTTAGAVPSPTTNGSSEEENIIDRREVLPCIRGVGNMRWCDDHSV